VLKHETPTGYEQSRHWDLMLEDDRGSLRTWSLAEAPCLDRQIYADELPPHRIEYLDYEGPISSDRGDVTRIMQGDYVDTPSGQLILRFEEAGTPKQWSLQVLFTDDATWVLFSDATT